jgi:CubicO group peptidase (beta-lactamase class C family)
MMRFFCVPAIMAFAIFHVATPAVAEDAIDEVICAEMEKQHIPGVSVLVARSGKILRAQGYGLSNVELQVPVKPETVFQSGSMGKQFTATAVMMLAEEGKIRLDDPIKRYIKDGPAAWNQVTVRELLSHTAGFTDYPKNFDFRKDYTEPELLKLVAAIPLAFQPGTKWSYSNLGYLTLGIMIHRVTGKFYGDVLQERIFRPLGMTTTRIMSESDIVPNRAAGYLLVKGVLKNQNWVSPTMNTTADGSLYFSVLDLAKWDASLYTEKLLKRSSLEEMWTVAKLKSGKENSGHYGFGWFVENVGGKRVVRHEGEWQGFTSFITRHLDDQTTVVLLTNLAGASLEPVAERIMEIWLRKTRTAGFSRVFLLQPEFQASHTSLIRSH